MKVVINVNDKRWKKYHIDFERIAKMAAGNAGRNSEISLVLTNDREIHKLNKQYRGFDKATNVLSFETGDDELLGDIFISFDTVMREAKSYNKTFEDHSAHMMVHGTLHLLGYDHLNDHDADKMESLEINILKKLGINNPYEDTKTKSRFNIRENGWLQYLMFGILGAISALGFAPFNFWPATLIGIGGAYYLTVRNLDNNNKNKFWKSLGQISPFGAAYGLGMFWWVVNSIFVVPELTAEFAIWTIPALIGIAIAGIFIFGIPFVLIRCMRQKSAYRPFLFALLWTIVLWLREWLFTGFPWNPIANITLPLPLLSNSMSVWGAIGLTFIIIGLIASTVEVIKNRRTKFAWVSLFVFVSLIIIGCGAGYKNIQRSDMGDLNDSPMVRIVQPAISQAEKATHSREQAIANAQNNLSRMYDLATKDDAKIDVIVFPETTYPYMIVDNTLPFVRELGVKTVIGSMSYRGGKFYNSLAVVNPDGVIEKLYSKSHLVPFGEYAPLGGLMPAPGNLTRGAGPEIINIELNGKDLNFAPAICYEIVFTDSLIPNKSDVQPNVVVNITNDTWFGKTPGTYQHLDMVRRYAIESGLPIIRSNYSGISAFIASDGTIVSSIPIGVADYLDGQVGGDHMTVYRKIGRDGWMVIILLFALCGAGYIRVRMPKD